MRYFLRYDRLARHRMKTVTIDMYAPYINGVQTCFPHAKLIIDPFHLVQALNREVNRTRIQVMNQYRHQYRPLYNKFKRYWKRLLKHPKHLPRAKYKKYRLFPEWKTSHGIVQYLLDVDDTLGSNHEYAHALAEALKKETSTISIHSFTTPPRSRSHRACAESYAHLKSTMNISPIPWRIPL